MTSPTAAPMTAPIISTPDELRRRVTELAVSALALGVAAFGLRLFVILWLPPVAWDLPDAVGMALLFLGTVVAAATPLAVFAAHVRRHRRLPRTFLVPDLRLYWWHEGRAFVVPPTPWCATFPVAYLVLAAGGVATERTADGGVTVAPEAWYTAFILAQPAAAAVLWFVLRGPQLALTRRGLLVRGLFSGPDGRLVAWDDLDVTDLPLPTRRTRELRIPVRGWGEAVVLPLTWLWVNPVYLAGAIRHYAQHAEHRLAIGNVQELDRLSAVLASQRERRGTGRLALPRVGWEPSHRAF